MLAIRPEDSPQIVNSVTVGADPEFLFLNRASGNVGNARQLLADRQIVLDDRSSNLGWDGASIPGELRPHFSTIPSHVVNNLAQLFAKLSVERPGLTRDYTMVAGNGGHGYTTGGHIHIGGFPFHVIPRTLLGSYMDTFLLPIGIALSRPSAVVDRIAVGYGEWGSQREQSWGMEYRSLPSWLYHPMTALFFLQAAKALSVSIMGANVDGEELVSFGYSPVAITTGRAPRFFIEASIRGMQKRALRAIDLLSSLPLMQTDSGVQSTRFVRDMIASGEVWEDRDILPNWEDCNLPDMGPPPPPVVPTPPIALPSMIREGRRMVVEYNTPVTIRTTPPDTGAICHWNHAFNPTEIAFDVSMEYEEVEDDDDDFDDDDVDYPACDNCGDSHDPDGDCSPMLALCDDCGREHWNDNPCPDCYDCGREHPAWHECPTCDACGRVHMDTMDCIACETCDTVHTPDTDCPPRESIFD